MKKLLLAIVGAMLCVALPCLAAQPKYETKPTKVEVVGEVKIAEPPARPDPTVVPCDPSKDIRTSDLCAQWKAADATEDSALWPKIAFVIGALLNVGTLVFVAFTFQETRKSVSEGRRSADAAVEATAISKKAFELAREEAEMTRKALAVDRAWIIAEKPSGSFNHFYGPPHDLAEAFIWYSFDIENYGSTPALDVQASIGYSLVEPGEKPLVYKTKDAWLGAIAKGKPFEISQSFQDEAGYAVLNGKMDCYIRLIVVYHDVFSAGGERTYQVVYRLSIGEMELNNAPLVFTLNQVAKIE